MACGPARVAGSDDDETTTTGSPQGSESSTSVGTEPDPSATGGVDASSSSSESGDPTDTMPEPDGMPSQFECDMFMQDCPPGEKCMPYAYDGSNDWTGTRCTPVVDDPNQAGEPCTVEDGATSGLDDCDLGMMCWNVDAETLEGRCVSLCGGSRVDPMCENPDTQCQFSATGILYLCLPTCHPLDADCYEDDLCVMFDDAGLCIPDAGPNGGAYGDACEFLNVCDSGLFCAAANFVPGCDEDSTGCCTPYCDISLANTCPGDGQECIPWFEENAPEGYENLGACALPQ